MINALLIGFMIGIIIFSIVKSTVGLFTLIPLYFIYIFVNSSNKNKELEQQSKLQTMTQSRFSELIKSFLNKNYPAFTENIIYNEDDSFDCFLRSPTKEFSIWLSTYDGEITIGLKDPSGKTDIHTHITIYEEEEGIEYALNDLSIQINEIIDGKVVLYHSNQNGYEWTCDIDQVIQRKKTSEIIRLYSWKNH